MIGGYVCRCRSQLEADEWAVVEEPGRVRRMRQRACACRCVYTLPIHAVHAIDCEDGKRKRCGGREGSEVGKMVIWYVAYMRHDRLLDMARD
jgi:hypothetical protein